MIKFHKRLLNTKTESQISYLKIARTFKAIQRKCLIETWRKDTGPKGVTGHTGTDGSSMSDRIERYGEWDVTVGENISYGQTTGEDVIIQLIIDDGVSSIGHRKNCFGQDFNLVGIAAVDHKTYQTQWQQPKQSSNNQGKKVVLGGKGGHVGAAPQQEDEEEEQLLPGCVSVSTSSAVSMKGGQKVTKITKTYKFKDGSTKTAVQAITDG